MSTATMPFSTRGALTLLAAMAACVLFASPAWAEVPSVDAYGGQALVLGKPRPPGSHGGRGRGSSTVSTPGSRAEAAPSSRAPAGRESSSGESTSPSPRASGRTREAVGGGESTGAPTRRQAAKRRGKTNASSGRVNGAANTARADAREVGLAQEAGLARETQPIGLSGSDLALLLIVAAGLALTGVLVRVLSQRPS
jgi:hypothetical protein